MLYYDEKFKYANNPDEIVIGIDSDWLFLFCASIIFRVIGIAVNGSMKQYGNYEEIYQLFVSCRELLEIKGSRFLAKPKIGVFLTPVHELLNNASNISPALLSIIMSKGIGACSEFTLIGGERLHDKIDFLWCSIGTINIVAGVSEHSFDLVPLKCMVIPGQKKFIIPPALQRYLVLPRGLLKEFEYLASKHTNRVLNTPKVTQLKQEWMFEEFSSFEKYACAEITAINLDTTNDQDDYTIFNYLPKPFNTLQQGFATDKISPARVIVHSTSMTDDATVITSVFVLTMTDDYSKYALMQIRAKKLVVWIAYSLSAEDYSIKGLLQCKNKKILGEIEKKFNTKSALVKELNVALRRTGFSSLAHLALWMHISW